MCPLEIDIISESPNISQVVLKGTIAENDVDAKNENCKRLIALCKTTKYLLLFCGELNFIRSCGVAFFLRQQEEISNLTYGKILFIKCNDKVKNPLTKLGEDSFVFFENKEQAFSYISTPVIFHFSKNLKRIIKSYSLNTSCTIGRGKNFNINLVHKSISRKGHAKIFWEEENYKIQPMQPSVEINFKKISSITTLQDYDYIKLGEEILLFRDCPFYKENSPYTEEVDFQAHDIKEEIRLDHSFIEKYRDRYYRLFNDVTINRILDFSQLETFLYVYSLISPKLFQPTSTDREEICEMVMGYIVQLIGNVNLIVLGFWSNHTAKPELKRVRNRNSGNNIVVDKNLIYKSLFQCKEGILGTYDTNRRVIAIPLFETEEDRKIGFLYIETEEDSIKANEKLVILQTNMPSLVRAFQNTFNFEKEQVKALLYQEIEQGKIKQKCLSPQKQQKIPYMQICCGLDQSMGLGGDYYDIITKQNSCYILLGDAQGHGVGAAIMAATVRAYLHILLQGTPSLNDVLIQVSELIQQDFTTESETNLMTLLILCWDWQNKTMEIWSAGHDLPLVSRYNKIGKRELDDICGTTNHILGLKSKNPFSSIKISLQPGDTMFLYTDGIPDAPNLREKDKDLKRRFELLNLKEQIKFSLSKDIKSIIEDVFDSIYKFMGIKNIDRESALFATEKDDMTFLALRCGEKEDCQGEIPTIFELKGVK